MTEITAHNVQTQPTTTMATIRSSAVAAEKVSLKFWNATGARCFLVYVYLNHLHWSTGGFVQKQLGNYKITGVRKVYNGGMKTPDISFLLIFSKPVSDEFLSQENIFLLSDLVQIYSSYLEDWKDTGL